MKTFIGVMGMLVEFLSLCLVSVVSASDCQSSENEQTGTEQSCKVNKESFDEVTKVPSWQKDPVDK